MCTTVYVAKPGADDVEVGTLGELREALGVEPIILAGYPDLPKDSCLCPCDIVATANAAGYDAHAECGAYLLTAR